MNQRRNIYVCPETRSPLKCLPGRQDGDEVDSGQLVSESGQEYPIRNRIPDLRFPRELGRDQKAALDYYEGIAGIYDDIGHLCFTLQYLDEAKTRREFVKLLK